MKMHWVRRLSLPLFLVCTVVSAQQTSMPRPSGARPLKDRVADFEKPERDKWQMPDEVIKALELKRGFAVADIGAGSGYFTRRFAEAVASEGKVYAVDISEDILGYLKEEAQKQNLNNITIVVSKEDDPKLPEHSVNLAFFCDTTHHIANRINFYRKLGPALKEGGLMAIIDVPPEAPDRPHNPEQMVPRRQVIDEAEDAGFKLEKEFKFLPRQYFLVFKKK